MILTTHYSYPTHPSLIDGLPHGPILVHLFFRALILSHLKRSLVGFKLRGFKLIVTGGSPKNPILELSEELFLDDWNFSPQISGCWFSTPSFVSPISIGFTLLEVVWKLKFQSSLTVSLG